MKDIATYIDHTLLKADARLEAIKKICDEAKEHHFKSVCVNSCHCRFVAEQLKGRIVLSLRNRGDTRQPFACRTARTRWIWSSTSAPPRTATGRLWRPI